MTEIISDYRNTKETRGWVSVSKRVWSMILAACLMLLALTGAALAAEDETVYRVGTVEELNDVLAKIAADSADSAVIELTADLSQNVGNTGLLGG